MLDALGKQLNLAIRKLLKYPTLNERIINEALKDIQRALIQADVDVNLVFSLSERVKNKVLNRKLPPALNRRVYTIATIYQELIDLLGKKEERKPFDGKIILLVGLQGSGKTTSAAKLAYYFKSRGRKPGVICADTYRPGAFEQLKQLSEEAGADFYGDLSSKNALKIVKNGIKELKQQGSNVFIIDTAGRHRKEKELFSEMQEMVEKIKPDKTMLVVDSTIGQQAYKQAEAFKKHTDLGYIFLTKLDGTAKGGGAISAVAATNATIAFIGTGEKVSDIEQFNAESFVSRLLGLGDVKGLLRKIEELEEKPSKEKIERIISGKFTLYDLMEQINAMYRLGPFKKIVEYLPGFKYSLPGSTEKQIQANIEKWKIIMQSMTKAELINPDIIDKSRIRRIAFGSGTTPKDVRTLLKYYKETKKMIRKIMKQKSLKKGKLPFTSLPLQSL